MFLIKPSYEILSIMGDLPYPEDSLTLIEQAGRVCYKSEDKIDVDTAIQFVKKLIDLGHESVLEHSAMTVKFICDRGVSHELVRHRLASFSQESTRYCNYGKSGVTYIIPCWLVLPKGEYIDRVDPRIGRNPGEIAWVHSMMDNEIDYLNLLKIGWTPQQARSVLPNSLKTELVVTANFREWRHILKLRSDKAAHPQMRELMIPLLQKVKVIIPVVFDDIKEN
jgi:thymidylate synthase (FAD)